MRKRISRPPSGTSWMNKVRIAAYAGETVWLGHRQQRRAWCWYLAGRERYVEFDGINMDGTNLSRHRTPVTGVDV